MCEQAQKDGMKPETDCRDCKAYVELSEQNEEDQEIVNDLVLSLQTGNPSVEWVFHQYAIPFWRQKELLDKARGYQMELNKLNTPKG